MLYVRAKTISWIGRNIRSSFNYDCLISNKVRSDLSLHHPPVYFRNISTIQSESFKVERFYCSSTMSDNTNNSIVSKLDSLFNKDRMRIKNKTRTENILKDLVEGGFSKLQIVADFDYTLTCMFDPEGERCFSSWGVLDNSPLMPDSFKSESQALLKKYYPIEISATMTEAEKIPFMEEWYKNVNGLLARCKVSRKDLDVMVSEGKCKLRVDTDKLLALLHTANVPVLVFSAGMGDTLTRILDRYNVNTDNVKVVSNFFKYDDQDRVAGFDGEMIHMFNKNENAIHSSPYFGELSSRTNVILMGDSLGDIQMAKGVPTPNNILKIGFLNEKIEERLHLYEDAYDIVLLNDQTMEVADVICKMLK